HGMQRQTFHYISGSGKPSKAGGFLAAISTIVVVAASLVIGGFVLLFGLVLAVALLIAFFIWRLFFFNKTKKKAEEFLRKNAAMYGGSQQGTAGSGANSEAGTVIDAEYEEVSTKTD
ncbi:MAG: hypothetical protein ACPGVN_08785, partial [Alphaproteobacteria bacterium]